MKKKISMLLLASILTFSMVGCQDTPEENDNVIEKDAEEPDVTEEPIEEDQGPLQPDEEEPDIDEEPSEEM